jgi:outer membrane receptor for ferrienterochelin and colicins
MPVNTSKILSVLISCLIIINSEAQNGVLTGTIFSKNEPLAFASVQLEGTKLGTNTNNQGEFKLTGIQAGSYLIQVTYLGYKDFKETIQFQSGDTLHLDIQLVENEDLMEEVVVTGTMKPTYVSKSPVKVDVITAKQLDVFLPAASSSIIDNIQLVNGVQEVTACGVCYTNSISINGLDGAYTAILMDGMPMYGNLASVYGLNGIPNMIIDRFEVIKGPNSTLYGSEAVAGVINIITKDPAKQDLLSIDIMGTSHLESFGNLAFAPKIGKSSGFVGLNYAYVNRFDDANKDGFGDGIHMDRVSLFTKWNFYRKSGKAFHLAAKYYYEDRRNGVEAFLKNRNYKNIRGSDSIYGESIYTNRAELFGTYAFDLPIDLKLDFSLSHHDQDSYYGADHYVAQQSIAFANLIFNKKWEKHDIVAGLTSRFNAYDDNSVATELVENNRIVNAPNNQFIPGIFVQDEYAILKNWILLPGIRLDHYDEHGWILTPRLSSKVDVGTWTSVRANFGTGFRVVNLFTEDHAFVTGQREVEITEELLPERSYNLSLSINHVYAAFDGTGTINLEGFFTHFTNKIIPDYDTPGKIIYANADGYARTKGIGISLDHQFEFPLAFNLGANLQSAQEFEPTGSGFSARPIEFAPNWTGMANVNYTWKEQKLNFGLTTQITGTMQLPEVYDLDSGGEPLPFSRPTTSEPFLLMNFQVNKSFDQGFSIYGGIQNLTDYRQSGSPLVGFDDPGNPAGFSPYFDTSYAYAPNHGREFYLGFKWSLKGKK